MTMADDGNNKLVRSPSEPADIIMCPEYRKGRDMSPTCCLTAFEEDASQLSDSDRTPDSENENMSCTSLPPAKRRRSCGSWCRDTSVKDTSVVRDTLSGGLLHVALGNRIASSVCDNPKTPNGKAHRLSPMRCPGAPRKAKLAARRRVPLKKLQRVMAPLLFPDVHDPAHLVNPAAAH